MFVKSISACAIGVLTLLWFGLAQAVGYPTEVQFRQSIEDISSLLHAEGIAVEVFDAQKEGMTTPLLAAGLSINTNTCIVFFNTKPEDGLTQFFASLNEREMPSILRAMSVHEVTHCVEQREAYIRRRFDKTLPDTHQQSGMTVEGYLSVIKSGAVETWGEALADISSVLYLKQSQPALWLGLARRISHMRHDLATKWPQHDTSVWLNRVIQMNPDVDSHSSLFDAAFYYRRKFNPN